LSSFIILLLLDITPVLTATSTSTKAGYWATVFSVPTFAHVPGGYTIEFQPGDYFIFICDLKYFDVQEPYTVWTTTTGEATLMDSNTDSDTPPFERELEELICTAFARGTAIEGQWEITVPVSSAPDWTVIIEKRVSETDPTYEPSFLDDC
jgi:hypothetical protein